MDAIRNFEATPHNVNFLEEHGGFGYSRIFNRYQKYDIGGRLASKLRTPVTVEIQKLTDTGWDWAGVRKNRRGKV